MMYGQYLVFIKANARQALLEYSRIKVSFPLISLKVNLKGSQKETVDMTVNISASRYFEWTSGIERHLRVFSQVYLVDFKSIINISASRAYNVANYYIVGFFQVIIITGKHTCVNAALP